MKIITPLLIAAAISLSLWQESALADRRESNSSTLTVGQSISDGKHGPWAEWKQTIDTRPVDSIVVRLRKEEGGRDTFCNLGFANGTNFDPMRAQIGDGPQTITWNVGGQSSGGRPLVMKAYNGRVHIESVSINYTPPPPRDHNSDRGGDRGFDRDRDRSSDWGSTHDSGFDGDRRLILDLADRLDRQANHAYKQVARNEYFTASDDLIGSVLHFSNQASEFHDELDSRYGRRRDLSDEIDHLLSDARKVQKQIRREGFASERSYEDWDKVMETLDRLADASR